MPTKIARFEDSLVPFGPIIELSVSIPATLGRVLHGQRRVVPHPLELRAVIDTGAEYCAFKPFVFEKLGLEPYDYTPICSTTSEELRPLYDVALTFERYRIEGVKAIESPLTGCTVEGLIGRNILKMGDFTYDGRRNGWQLVLY